MANSLGVQEDGVVRLVVLPRVALSTMEVDVEGLAHGLSFGLGFVHLGHKVVDFRGEIFLIYHIEANDHICVLFGFKSSINLHLDVIFSNNFEAANNNSHFEQWDCVSNLSLDFVENFTLTFDSNWPIFVENHAENVFPFDNRDALLDHIFGNSVQNHFEKRSIIIKF